MYATFAELFFSKYSIKKSHTEGNSYNTKAGLSTKSSDTNQSTNHSLESLVRKKYASTLAKVAHLHVMNNSIKNQYDLS